MDLLVGDFATLNEGSSGTNIATSNAKITRIAPNANGGPGIIFLKEKHKRLFCNRVKGRKDSFNLTS